MKKLMIALAAAAAITGVAKADIDNHVTDFESLTNGIPFNAVNDDKDGRDDTYWAIEAGATEPYAIVTNADFNGSAGKKEGSEKALSIDTDKLLSRKVKAGDAGAESFGTAPLYFDGYVQFTAADSLPETEAGDKLVVWLYGGDADTDAATATALGLEDKVSTNLVITAGSLGEGGVITKTHYSITSFGGTALEILPNSWHRLTIKAIVKGDVPMFKVYVDDKLAKSGDVEEFTSLVANGAAAWNTLTSVSFKGTGAVDDLGFTNVDLFPEAAAETFTLTATVTGGEVALFDADENPIDGVSPWTLPLADSYFATFTPAEGYSFESATFGGETIEPSDVSEGTYIFALDFSGAAAGDAFALVITTSGGGSSDYPSYIEGIEDAATKAAYQTKYNAWKDTYGADAQSSYQSQFLLNIAPDQEAELTTAAIVVENGVVKITTSPAAGSVNGKVYIKKAETVQGLANTAWTEAAVSTSGDDVGKVTDNAGDAGFYQIKVDF